MKHAAFVTLDNSIVHEMVNLLVTLKHFIADPLSHVTFEFGH